MLVNRGQSIPEHLGQSIPPQQGESIPYRFSRERQPFLADFWHFMSTDEDENLVALFQPSLGTPLDHSPLSRMLFNAFLLEVYGFPSERTNDKLMAYGAEVEEHLILCYGERSYGERSFESGFGNPLRQPTGWLVLVLESLYLGNRTLPERSILESILCERFSVSCM